MNPLFADQPTSIFEHMSGLAREHGAVNLGQGFPDFGWPDDVLAKAAEGLTGPFGQYPPMRGLPELRQAIADHYAVHQGMDIPIDQVIVTSGATEALAASIAALVSPGDEVLLFQPVYDSYAPIVRLAGGVPRVAQLTPPGWRITADLLEQAITPQTRIVMFNNPHNPVGRMFDTDELGLLAEACQRHDLTVIADEVWEHIAFDGRRHIPLASLPGMADRVVKVGSAGKIFSLTGWKVGWAIAPAALARALGNAHQFLTFTTPPNLQAAVAYGLGKEDSYFKGMRDAFAEARKVLVGGLEAAGYALLPAEGTYFVCVDLAASAIPVDDMTFCERAVREAGVAAIPVSALCLKEPVTNVIRLCFAKRRETLDAGIAALAKARGLFVQAA